MRFPGLPTQAARPCRARLTAAAVHACRLRLQLLNRDVYREQVLRRVALRSEQMAAELQAPAAEGVLQCPCGRHEVLPVSSSWDACPIKLQATYSILNTRAFYSG